MTEEVLKELVLEGPLLVFCSVPSSKTDKKVTRISHLRTTRNVNGPRSTYFVVVVEEKAENSATKLLTVPIF